MGLVLKRKASEGVKIGEDITVEVVWTSRTQCKLNITAPDTIGISRFGASNDAAPNPFSVDAPAPRRETSDATT